MSVLVQQSVRRTLFGMAFPMLAGTFAMNAYNLTDTWFVAKLGTLPLAAMGFTFPVVMLLSCVARGIGVGVTTLVSHAIGRHDDADAARLVTHGMALTLVVTAVMSVGGYLTIGPLFRRLGADAATLPLVGEYMRTWYVGAVSMSLPMLGNGILLSAGDSKAASRFMMLGAGLNLVLDPVMIFGYFGFPAMGIRGAALATVIAQGVSTAWLLLLLLRKHRLLVFRKWPFSDYLASFQRILGFGVPSILSLILMPISAGVITRILSEFGNEAVAASGAAGRIEMFAFVIPMALGISLTPFISQNYGARRMDRVREAKAASTRFALFYGGAVAVAFFLGARPLAGAFSDDPKVIATLVAYIRIISFGYGMMEVHRYCTFFLTGLHRPVSASLLNALRVVGFLIPLSFLGAWLAGLRGVFFGRLVTDLAVGAIGLAWVERAFRATAAGAADPPLRPEAGVATLGNAPPPDRAQEP
ncbi:MAG TPA: MATE family efflux transporter [Planctomycetota bacterium]|nr:MATE family efflux transporter [Planctomycetota bacterium]HRR80572.1 MATE family efflux transporter [Planctomycetota bacterium]HRT97517.1 MATE family efflux transporter [Planctomycetota bacterium]